MCLDNAGTIRGALSCSLLVVPHSSLYALQGRFLPTLPSPGPLSQVSTPISSYHLLIGSSSGQTVCLTLHHLSFPLFLSPSCLPIRPFLSLHSSPCSRDSHRCRCPFQNTVTEQVGEVRVIKMRAAQIGIKACLVVESAVLHAV